MLGRVLGPPEGSAAEIKGEGRARESETCGLPPGKPRALSQTTCRGESCSHRVASRAWWHVRSLHPAQLVPLARDYSRYNQRGGAVLVSLGN